MLGVTSSWGRATGVDFQRATLQPHPTPTLTSASDPQPPTPNPQPSIPNPQPATLNSQPSTLNPSQLWLSTLQLAVWGQEVVSGQYCTAARAEAAREAVRSLQGGPRLLRLQQPYGITLATYDRAPEGAAPPPEGVTGVYIGSLDMDGAGACSGLLSPLDRIMEVDGIAAESLQQVTRAFGSSARQVSSSSSSSGGGGGGGSSSSISSTSSSSTNSASSATTATFESWTRRGRSKSRWPPVWCTVGSCSREESSTPLRRSRHKTQDQPASSS